MGMDSILNDLAKEIKNTSEYSKLTKAKTIIESNVNLKKELDGFNKKQIELFSGKLPAKEAQVLSGELNSKFESLSKISEVNNFLKASKEFNEMVARVSKRLNEMLGIT